MSEVHETVKTFLVLYGERADARDRAHHFVDRIAKHPVWCVADLEELRRLFEEHFDGEDVAD